MPITTPAATPPSMITAAELATAYDRYVAALWRGESEEVRRFGAWLKGCWELGSPEPSTPPAAISALGGAGASIRWHEAPADCLVLGYIPGVLHRCYRIPNTAVVPVLSPYPRSRAAPSLRGRS